MAVSGRRAVLLGAGVVLLLGAGALRFAAVPYVTRLPDDVNQFQEFTGTYSGLNPTALTGGTGPAHLDGAPVTAQRGLVVERVDGDVAVVRFTSRVRVQGEAQEPVVSRFAVNRGDLSAAAVPAGASGVTPSQGQVFSLPRHPDPGTTYRLWDPLVARAVPLIDRGEATVDGRAVRRYELSSSGPVADPASSHLPTVLRREQMTTAAPALASSLPTALRANLPALMARMPASLPLRWTTTNRSLLDVDTEFGVPIRSDTTQQLTAVVAGGMSFPFSSIRLVTTDSSAADTVSELESGGRWLLAIETVVPAVLAVLGLVLLILGLRRRRS
jgi:hypothetical protein